MGVGFSFHGHRGGIGSIHGCHCSKAQVKATCLNCFKLSAMNLQLSFQPRGNSAVRFRTIASIALVLAACGLVASISSDRPTVALTFLEYGRWPHGAMLRLTNGTATTIQYRSETNGRRPVFRVKEHDGSIRRHDELFTVIELKPGKAEDFWVSLKPDAPAVEVGIFYDVPVPPRKQGRLSMELDNLWLRAKRLLGLRILPRSATKQIWTQPLSVSSSRQPPESQ